MERLIALQNLQIGDTVIYKEQGEVIIKDMLKLCKEVTLYKIESTIDGDTDDYESHWIPSGYLSIP